MRVSTSTEKNLLLFTVGEILNCGHLASSSCGGESGAEESSVHYGRQESKKGRAQCVHRVSVYVCE